VPGENEGESGCEWMQYPRVCGGEKTPIPGKGQNIYGPNKRVTNGGSPKVKPEMKKKTALKEALGEEVEKNLGGRGGKKSPGKKGGPVQLNVLPVF